ncbi:MAG: hypothetical protein IKV86_00425 [Clostridia bacterium]|nr:hypothetical protein [Clostridia bacterium]
MALFYTMVIFSYILNNKIGFNLPWSISYAVSAVVTVAYAICIVWCGKKRKIDNIY